MKHNLLLFFLLASFSSFTQSSLSEGLVTQLLFKGNANDLSTNNIKTQVFGAKLASDRFGNLNSAYEFNGSSDYIEMDPVKLKNANYSYSAWVKILALPGNSLTGVILSIGDSQSDQGLSINNSYTNGFDGFTGGSYTGIGRNAFVQDLILPNINIWYNVSYVRSNDSLYLYVNGKLKASKYSGGFLPYYGSSAGRATIGRRAFGSGQFANIVLDDLYIYDRALSSGEVKALYNINSSSSGDIDLKLKATSSQIKTLNDNIGEVKFVLKNENLENQATNVKVLIKVPYIQPYSIFESSNSPKGIFEIGSNLWSIDSINPGDSTVLTLKYKILNSGTWYLEAEVFSVDQKDSDSTPMNSVEFEDDYSKACFSIPIKISDVNTFGRQIIIEDENLNTIIWKKDGNIIPNQNSKILQVTSLGMYTFESPSFICPLQGCCPFIFEVGENTSNCCLPLEYILKK